MFDTNKLNRDRALPLFDYEELISVLNDIGDIVNDDLDSDNNKELLADLVSLSITTMNEYLNEYVIDQDISREYVVNTQYVKTLNDKLDKLAFVSDVIFQNGYIDKLIIKSFKNDFDATIEG